MTNRSTVAPAERSTRIFQDTRLERERRTIAAMVRIYCQDQHHVPLPDSQLCDTCASLLQYATVRLQRCRFGPDKPTCVQCPVHCYLPDRREQVREVMRKSGPKMALRHPWLSLMHFLDKYRKVPAGPCPLS